MLAKASVVLWATPTTWVADNLENMGVSDQMGIESAKMADIEMVDPLGCFSRFIQAHWSKTMQKEYVHPCCNKMFLMRSEIFRSEKIGVASKSQGRTSLQEDSCQHYDSQKSSSLFQTMRRSIWSSLTEACTLQVHPLQIPDRQQRSKQSTDEASWIHIDWRTHWGIQGQPSRFDKHFGLSDESLQAVCWVHVGCHVGCAHTHIFADSPAPEIRSLYTTDWIELNKPFSGPAFCSVRSNAALPV